MFKSTRMITGALLVAAAFAAAPAQARVDLGIFVGAAPPAPQIEYVQEERPGYDWAPGHWEWNGRRYVWAEGYWIESRPGFVWAPDHWVQHGNRWQYVRGNWAHGNAHDYDRYYSNVRWGDRDHNRRWEDRRNDHHDDHRNEHRDADHHDAHENKGHRDRNWNDWHHQ